MKYKKVLFFAIGGIMFLLFIGLFLPYLLSFFGVNSYIVKSKSMEHTNEEDFYSSWENMGYNNSEASKFPFSNGIYLGDIILTEEADEYNIGDVIIHRKPNETRIRVHRLAAYNNTHFSYVEDYLYINQRVVEQMYFYPRSLLDGKVTARLPRIGIFAVAILCLTQPEGCHLFGK